MLWKNVANTTSMLQPIRNEKRNTAKASSQFFKGLNNSISKKDNIFVEPLIIGY